MKLLKKEIYGMPLGIAIFSVWLVFQGFSKTSDASVDILFGMVMDADSMSLWNGFYTIFTPILITAIALSTGKSFPYKRQSYLLALIFMTILVLEALMSSSAVMFSDSLFDALIKNDQSLISNKNVSVESIQNIFNVMMFIKLVLLSSITYCLYVNKAFFNK